MELLPWLDRPPGDRAEDLHHESLAKRVRDDLLALILAGRLSPGQRISEPDIARRHEVSRVPVREALRELESAGLVISRKYSGVFVRELDASEVRNLYEIRAVFDGLAAARAAAAGDEERRQLCERLSPSIERMRASTGADQLQAYYRANLQFHWDLVTATGNAELESSYRALIQKLHLSRLRNLARSASMLNSIAEHEMIAAAVRVGDAARARQLAESHVNDAWLRLSKEVS